MNEKVRALAVQSGIIESHVDWIDGGGALIEKLAELLVEECCTVLKDELDEYFAAEYLEEHFKVEE